VGIRREAPDAELHWRRLQVRFASAELELVARRARRSGLSLSAAVRELVSSALSTDPPMGTMTDSPASLAALLAAEHSLLMVASVLPEGERRMHELNAQAAVAAEARLALFRESGP
jgi:hypothetical protein